MRRARTAVLATAVVSCAATAAVGLLPQLDFAYRRPQLHVALETVASLVALITAFLMAGRLRRHGRLSDLVVACGLGTLAVTNLVPLLALVATGSRQGGLLAWVALSGRSLSAALFAAAAFLPDRRLSRPPRTTALAGAVVLLAGAAICVTAWRMAPDPTLASPVPPNWPDLRAQPVPLAVQLTAATLYGMAAAGFLTRARRRRDELFAWLAIASVLAAASHLNYSLYPTLLSAWVHTGDAFRLASYVVLLAGAMREIASHWHALSQAAVAAERHRIARDLHDGVAQELAYLVRNLNSLNRDTGAARPTLDRLRRAAERAELESRRAITTLAAPCGQAVAVTVAAAVSEIAERFGLGVDLDLADGVRLDDTRAEAVVRIACEAVANAARHSGASRVELRLERDGSRVRLGVTDAGCGFDAAAGRGGFGLISMHERARSVGGELRISSAPGYGSRVEVTL